jgi:hypothetical protein
MAGRSYKVIDGRRTLLPTERQLIKLEEIKKRLFSDENGYSENSLFSDRAMREHLIDWAKTQDPEYLAKLIKEGKITEDYVKAMWLRNYLDRKNGIMPSDISNPESRWNLKRLEEIFHNQPMENGALWDKFGTFLGWTRGEKDLVQLSWGTGMLAGGTLMHNHPRMEYTGLGGGFSVLQKMADGRYAGDFLIFKESGAKEVIASAVEGYYTLSAPKNPNFTKKDLKLLQSESYQMRIQTFDKYSKIRGSFASGIYARVDAYQHYQLLRDFARRHGCDYTFTPRSGFETLMDPKSLGTPLNRYPNQ